MFVRNGKKLRQLHPVGPRLGAHIGGRDAVAGYSLPTGDAAEPLAVRADSHPGSWETRYRRTTFVADLGCSLLAGLSAFVIRFGDSATDSLGIYLGISFALPGVWVIFVGLAGGYDQRFIGVGSEEFRRVFNAGVFLTATVGVISYAAKAGLARGYVVIALPSLTILDLGARYAIRKRLHRLRRDGQFMGKVIAVGYRSTVAELATLLKRDRYHGLSIVAACLADLPDSAGTADPPGTDARAIVAGIPLIIGLGDIVGAVQRFGADVVAVLPCPEMSGVRLRDLAWQLEKSGTDLCVAPALPMSPCGRPSGQPLVCRCCTWTIPNSPGCRG